MPLLTAGKILWIAEEFGSCLALAMTVITDEDKDTQCTCLADTGMLQEVLGGRSSEVWVPALAKWTLGVLAPSISVKRGWSYRFIWLGTCWKQYVCVQHVSFLRNIFQGMSPNREVWFVFNTLSQLNTTLLKYNSLIKYWYLSIISRYTYHTSKSCQL